MILSSDLHSTNNMVAPLPPPNKKNKKNKNKNKMDKSIVRRLTHQYIHGVIL